jgi:hypothetical protein
VTDNDSKEGKEDVQLESHPVNMASDSNFVEGFGLHMQFFILNILLFNML